MKKLLLIGPAYVHTYNYYRLIHSYFDDIKLITEKDDVNAPMVPFVVDFSLKRLLNHWVSVQKLKKIIAGYQPSVIHIHQANSFAYYSLRAASAFNIPTVLTAWGSDVLLLPKSGFIMKQMVKYNLKKATALTADAQFMAKKMALLSHRPESEILIANFGIDSVEVKAEKENIIYSNRLHKPLYRIDSIIKAFAHFYKTETGRNWKLIIAGTGEQTESLKKMAHDLNLNHAIEFIGWVDKNRNAEMYSKASVYVSIPVSDGTSISLLEAMAHGCFPVVSRLPANEEWITHCKNGLLTEGDDYGFLTAAMQCDFNAAADQNKLIIEQRGTRAANKRLFEALYDSIMSPG